VGMGTNVGKKKKGGARALEFPRKRKVVGKRQTEREVDLTYVDEKKRVKVGGYPLEKERKIQKGQKKKAASTE